MVPGGGEIRITLGKQRVQRGGGGKKPYPSGEILGGRGSEVVATQKRNRRGSKRQKEKAGRKIQTPSLQTWGRLGLEKSVGKIGNPGEKTGTQRKLKKPSYREVSESGLTGRGLKKKGGKNPQK